MRYLGFWQSLVVVLGSHWTCFGCSGGRRSEIEIREEKNEAHHTSQSGILGVLEQLHSSPAWPCTRPSVLRGEDAINVGHDAGRVPGVLPDAQRHAPFKYSRSGGCEFEQGRGKRVPRLFGVTWQDRIGECLWCYAFAAWVMSMSCFPLSCQAESGNYIGLACQLYFTRSRVEEGWRLSGARLKSWTLFPRDRSEGLFH